jgi:hypothetical protein
LFGFCLISCFEVLICVQKGLKRDLSLIWVIYFEFFWFRHGGGRRLRRRSKAGTVVIPPEGMKIIPVLHEWRTFEEYGERDMRDREREWGGERNFVSNDENLWYIYVYIVPPILCASVHGIREHLRYPGHLIQSNVPDLPITNPLD